MEREMRWNGNRDDKYKLNHWREREFVCVCVRKREKKCRKTTTRKTTKLDRVIKGIEGSRGIKVAKVRYLLMRDSI